MGRIAEAYEEINQLLALTYGQATAQRIRPRLEKLLQEASRQIRPPTRADDWAQDWAPHFDQSDAVLITYADMVQRAGQAPLRTLGHFLSEKASGLVSTVHLLPFYPFSSDDGFSVIDYRAVDPALGTWKDVAQIGRSFRLMFDAVINHISAQSPWFQGFLQGDPRYRDFFVAVDPAADLSAVFRPRALPLLTKVATAAGPKYVWTTFSSDQIDLNYANPEVLLEIVDLLLFYVAKGAELIRLDAIAFMWKELGTDCLHRPQAHHLIQLFRSVLDVVAPHVALITETNVPHQENIAYFGDGTNEAQMVYNFSLPPLTLHAFQSGTAEVLSDWASTLTLPSDRVTFFNFLASHDGIGLTPARGLLPEEALSAVAERVLRLGGQVSYRHNPDGTQSAYELNINYLDALGDPDHPGEDVELTARRFLASQALMLALRGVPGIYFHSLFGSRGWPEGVQETGRARTINRQKLALDRLEAELALEGSLRQRVFDGYGRLLQARRQAAAFDPYGEQAILRLNPAVFAVRRTASDGRDSVLCLHNVSAEPVQVDLPAGNFVDHFSQATYAGRAAVTLTPYQVLWLGEVQ